MGSSIAMIDYPYGHLARDSREHAVSLLDAFAIEPPQRGLTAAQVRGFDPLVVWLGSSHT
jgi:hypothetical protein